MGTARDLLEEWKDIKGYPEYQVSNLGRVKRKACVRHHKLYGNYRCVEKILKPTPTKKGYNTIKLTNSNGHKTFTVHRLVAKAFIPNINDKPQINHINGIKTDNRVENLEWVTNQENQLHAHKIGLNKTRKFNEEQVKYILYSTIATARLAEKYGVNYYTIWDIRNGRSYKSIVEKLEKKYGNSRGLVRNRS